MIGRRMAESLPDLVTEFAHPFYKPDFTTENNLYSVCDGFNNQIDMMMQKPQYSQRLQLELSSLQSDVPASSLYDNDSDISASCQMRQYDVNEVSEYLENNLRDEYRKRNVNNK